MGKDKGPAILPVLVSMLQAVVDRVTTDLAKEDTTAVSTESMAVITVTAVTTIIKAASTAEVLTILTRLRR